MKSITPIGCTHLLKAPENWNDETDGPCKALSCRVQTAGRFSTFTSAWKPTADELAALAQGAAIEIELLGTQPPVLVYVNTDYIDLDRKTVEVEKGSITINEEGHGFDEHGPATP